MKLIKVARARLGGVETIRTPSGETLVYSSRARTLVDAVYDWSQFDSLPEAYDWIRNDFAAGRVTADELARVAVQYGNRGTIRRIGAILERLDASNFSFPPQAGVDHHRRENPVGAHAPCAWPDLKDLGVVING